MATQHEEAWPGFSPGPVSVTMSPEPPGFEFSRAPNAGDNRQQSESPLVFMRTPGPSILDNTCPNSSKRFNNWMESTSPYTARKTPPTASMKSVTAGADENTPPGLMTDRTHNHTGSLGAKGGGSSVGSQQHFQAWLRATNSTSWTPRKSPAAATPPPGPAPSPAATPMSVMRDLQHSAATPPSTRRSSRAPPPPAAAAAASGFDTSDDDDEDDSGEAATTIGAAQLAAATDRAAAASRMAAGLRAHSGSSILQQQQQPGRQQLQRHLSTPPRVPAPSPVINSPAALGGQQQHQEALLLQAAADRMVQDSLATPMSHLSISRRAGGQHSTTAADGAATPGELVMRSLSRAGPSGPPASPAEKLIGLMMSPGADGQQQQHRRQHHHHAAQQQQQMTPSRLSAALGGLLPAGAQAPLSPNMQVIDLMLQREEEAQHGAAAAGGGGAAAAAAGSAAGSDVGGSGSSVYGGDDDDDEESADEMDLSELQALCGDAVGPDTPLSVILGMLTGTPEVAGLTPRLGPANQQQQGAGDDIGPRVLFADE